MSQITTDAIEQRTIRKITLRLIPFLFLLYIIAYLDRVNIGYAALEMNQDLGITSEVFGAVAGIFFLGYFLFEVPSNILLNRLGARVWIARILVSWGIVVVMTGFVQSAGYLYVLRFLLGVAEAGFFPGIVLYITFWFPARARGRAIALFMTAIAASQIIGAPLSTWLMTNIHWFGLEGWRWMFILEGLPAVLLGIVTYFYLIDRPEKAKWLTAEEKDWLIQELQKDRKSSSQAHTHSTKESLQALKNPKVWYLAIIYSTLGIGQLAIAFWLPTILKDLSSALSNIQIGLISMLPNIAAAVAMVFWARRSDRTGERYMHAAIPALIGAFGLLMMGFMPNPVLSMVMLTIAMVGMYCFFGPFWALSSVYLGEAAVIGIAVINSIGNLGGFLGPYGMGMITERTGSVQIGILFLGASVLVSAIMVLMIRIKKKRTAADVNQPPQVKV